MLAQYLDLTEEFNNNLDESDHHFVIFETSNYDYALVQLVLAEGVTDFISAKSTLDSDAVTGVSDGSAVSSTNYSDIVGLNLSSNSFSIQIFNGIVYRFNLVGRYMKLVGSTQAVKLLVMLSKIS